MVAPIVVCLVADSEIVVSGAASGSPLAKAPCRSDPMTPRTLLRKEVSMDRVLSVRVSKIQDDGAI
jgi:hypothetical protein